MQGFSIALLSQCGPPCFGELLLIIFDHVGQKIGPFYPILQWYFLPLLNPLGIHALGLGEFYQFITDEVWFGESAVFVWIG